jgi:hypothetical protein
VRTSLYFGLAKTRFDLTLRGADDSYRMQDESDELYLQYGLHSAFSETFEIGLEGAFSFGREYSGIGEIDLSLDYALLPQLHLSGGYRWLNYAYGIDSDESNIEVDFRGPFIGLRFVL